MTPATLNDDVYTEILLRLPPKSVFRSRAVCKLWRSITTCDHFVAAYNRRQPLELILYNGKSAIAAVPLNGTGTGCRPLLRHRAFLDLFGSCDGLLLFSQDHGSFLVCNPATRQWAILPPLAPWPCQWVVPTGFYLHSPSGEHRVLCYGLPVGLQSPSWNHLVHYVLSTGGAEPRRLGPMDECPNPGYPSAPASGVDVGGTLYWVKHPQIGKTSAKMLAFDTVTESFRRMPLPSITGREYNDLALFDMHGTLAASVVAECPCLQVWALDDGDTWSRRLCVELPALQGPRRSWLFGTDDTELSPTFEFPLFEEPVRGPSRLLDEAVAGLEGDKLVVFASGWVVMYDMKEKRMVSKVEHTHNCSLMRWCVHRESLVPPVLNGQPFPGGEPILPFHDNIKGQVSPATAIQYLIS